MMMLRFIDGGEIAKPRRLLVSLYVSPALRTQKQRIEYFGLTSLKVVCQKLFINFGFFSSLYFTVTVPVQYSTYRYEFVDEYRTGTNVYGEVLHVYGTVYSTSTTPTGIKTV